MLLALAAHCQRLVAGSTGGAPACAAKGRGDSAQLSMDEEQLLLLAQRCFWELSWAPAALRQSGVVGRAFGHLTEVGLMWLHDSATSITWGAGLRGTAPLQVISDLGDLTSGRTATWLQRRVENSFSDDKHGMRSQPE